MYFFNVGFNAKNNIRSELSFQQGMSAHIIFSMDNSQLNKKIKQNLYIYIKFFKLSLEHHFHSQFSINLRMVSTLKIHSLRENVNLSIF